jgi:NADPH:quinone reductase-like Zn-dependent oxidoreductase
MKALYLKGHGGLEQLEYGELPVPEPAPDQVLLRVRAAALNHLDLWTVQKVPGLAIPFPHVPGNDMAGVVERVGAQVTHVKPGDEVVVAPGVGCGLCESCAAGDDHLCRLYFVYGYQRHGGLAQYAVVRGNQLRRKPPGIDWPEAASAGLVFLTAWHMIAARARLLPGETCLVMAAGSGVGIAAIQIARLFGARVIATAGSDAKLARAQALGAHDTINYSDPEWPRRVRELSAGRGVDVVIEHTGEHFFEACVGSLAKNGRLVTCGATSGPRATFDLRLLFARHLNLLGSYMGSRAEWHRVWGLLEAGRLHPVVDSVYPLSEGRRAFERMQSREVFGKLVLIPESP